MNWSGFEERYANRKKSDKTAIKRFDFLKKSSLGAKIM